MSRFLLAIPIFNERRHVLGVLSEVKKYISDILVIDDGSTDGTTDLIREVEGISSITHPENRGYGQSLISAFDFAVRSGHDWLITMDCDEQHEPAFLPEFIRAALRDDADLISGSRYMRQFKHNSPPPSDRRRINCLITQLLNQILGLKLTDSFCGFKAYRISMLPKLSIDVPGYAMPLQLWVQAVDHGFRIREIPVRLIYNDPNRHFGGMLDNPTARLEHYIEVLSSELLKRRLATAPVTVDQLGSTDCL